MATNKHKINTTASFFFISSILQKAENFARHMDNQTNILLGLSSGIFVLSASQIRTENGSIVIPLLVLAIFSLVSALMAIFAIIPPRTMRKKGQKESLLYNKKISEFKSPKQYAKELLEVSRDFEKITQECATELYNLSRYYYQPKRRLFKWSRNLLLLGLSLSLLMIALGLF